MRSFIIPLALVAAFGFAPTSWSTLAAEEHAHEHGAGGGHKAGDVTIGSSTFSVEFEGEVTPGKEVEVKLMPKGEAPKAVVRAWIGIESGKGSAKAKAHSEDGGLCCHTEAPDPLPADAKLWIEVDVDGTKTKASVALPKHKH